MISPHESQLWRALERVAPHDHLCSIYESSEEHLAVAIAFIRTGLDRGERCVYIADDGTLPILRDAMEGAGIDVERVIASGRLALEPNPRAYLDDGNVVPETMLRFLKDATADAASHGFPALRLATDSRWTTGRTPGLERWTDYESRLTRGVAQQSCSMLCQFDRRVCPPELIVDVIRTHPMVVYRGTVSRNVHHVPPDSLLGEGKAEHEVERLLSSIGQHDLPQSEGLLRQVLDALPVGLVVVNAKGDILLTNPASQRIWGGSLWAGPERYVASKGWWHASGKRLAPDDWASVRARTKGEVSLDEVLDIETFDGVRRTIRNSAVPIRDANGAIAGAIAINEDVSAREAADRDLKDSLTQLRMLTARLMRAQDDERRRIAQLLHDSTAQHLAALKMLLARLERAPHGLGDSERQALTECISLADLSMEDVRTLSYLLYPPFLDDMGLASALRWYTAGFAERSGTQVALELPSSLARLSPEMETALFRVVQEALINIHRHAGSETACIRLRSDAERLVLEIDDRGRGISSAALEQILAGGGTAGVGIASMSERIKQLGGRLNITSSPHGTTVRVELPLAKGGD